MLLAGCRDDAALTPGTGPEGSALDAHASTRLRDPEIDQGDTWFAIDIISETSAAIPLSTPLPDRRTGRSVNTLEFRPRPEPVHVEAGYGADDQLRLTIYREEGTIRSVGNHVVSTNAAGEQVSSTTPGDIFGQMGLPLASMENTSIAGGLFVDTAAFERALRATDPGDPGLVRGRADRRGGRIRVHRPDDDRLHVTVEGGATQANTEIPGTMVRRYRKHARPGKDGKREAWWVLEEVEHTAEMQQNAGTRRRHTITRIRQARWNQNREQEARRFAAIKARRRSQLRSNAAAAPVAAPAPLASLAPAGPTPSTASLTTNESEFPCGPGGPEHFAATGSSGRNVVFQHGICSDAGTWNGMRPRVSDRFYVATEQAYSVNDAAPLWYQALELEGKLRASGTRDNVVVGHSQGGLVARRTAQMESGLVSGVVSISSPHTGAMIADFTPKEATGALVDAVARLGGYCLLPGCGTIGHVANELPYRYFSPPNDGDMPARLDNQRGSPFLDSLNSRYEPFRRAGIENDAGPRFSWARLIGDAGSPREAFNPQGQSTVNDVWTGYDNAYYVMLFGMLLMSVAITDDCYYGGNYWSYGDYWYYGGYYGSSYWCDPYDPYLDNWFDWGTYHLGFLLYFFGSAARGVMDDVDWTWDYLTTRNEALSEPYWLRADAIGPGTDGFVQLSGQRYPETPGAFSPLRRPIPYAHSHTGVTASPLVLHELTSTLGQFGLPQRF
jgi:pimeloyl-ACP methyl ester carboxylesterase